MLQSAIDAFKATSKRAIQKTPEATDDLIGNKIAGEITKVSRTSPRNSYETVRNEYDKEIPKERYVSQKIRKKTERQKDRKKDRRKTENY